MENKEVFLSLTLQIKLINVFFKIGSYNSNDSFSNNINIDKT